MALERRPARPVFPPNDPTGAALVKRYFDEMMRRFLNNVDMLYPEIEPGVRMPAFHNQLPGEMVHFRLEEISRRAALVQQGVMEPDEETERFMANVDGAQEKLLELRAQYNRAEPEEAE